MDFELRVVVEKVAVSTQAIVQLDTVKVYDITCPTAILELGLRHREQILLLEKIQNAVLAAQSKLIAQDQKVCPQCGEKLIRNGYSASTFHAVFSDHKLHVQKHRCNNPTCRWQRVPTITSLFGTNIHPDLAKLQCEQGALFSYREAQGNLEKLNTAHRSVNNHTQISRLTDHVEAILSEQHRISPPAEARAAPASALILQVDGGHIPIQNKGKRSFEALSATVYRPENLQVIDQHHREITNKSCAVSAKDDNLETMKTYLLNAAHKQGMDQNTIVTALADGATNCWSVIFHLKSHCQTLEPILDWFHVAKKFQTLKNALADRFEETLERCKWAVWHGKVKKVLSKLEQLRVPVADAQQRAKIQGLHDYLKRNQDYIVNYDDRKKANQVFTTHVAESPIGAVINARHKRTGKMQWSREGAHNVLQIRAAIASKEWPDQWQVVVLSALGAVA